MTLFKLLIIALFFATSAQATTKGLSQIVTPDLQGVGDFSVSYQQQADAIGNPSQFQGELGLTSWSEIAIFQGLKPNETIFGAEIGFIQHSPWLLTAGIVNVSTRGTYAQPFLESGYYSEHFKTMLGMGYQKDIGGLLIAGLAYDFDEHWRAQVDFQSSLKNFSTVGFTYTLNDRFQFNPAIYFSNEDMSKTYGYIVLTYTFPLLKKHPDEPASKPEAL